jgi:hypothetical protein
MSLYQDLLKGHYLDPTYGVVANAPGAFCDNFNLYSAEAMLVANWGLWPQYEAFYRASEVEPGLMVRYPGRQGGGISQDEMTAAATLSDFAAKRIYEYGSSHWWYFNPDKLPIPYSIAGLKRFAALWFGRFIGFPGYIEHCATGKMSIFKQVLWSIETMLSCLNPVSNTSGKLLKWIQLRNISGHYKLCDLAIKFWKSKMMKQYPNGLRGVMYIYFSETHPLTLNARKDFE